MFGIHHIATRLPSLRARRPVPHRLAMPRRYARPRPPTVLDRQRRLSGRPPFAVEVEGRAERIATAIRSRLAALRRNLQSWQRRLADLTGSRRRAGGF